jgi:hypothetical protein
MLCLKPSAQVFIFETTGKIIKRHRRGQRSLSIEHYFNLYPPWAIATWWSKWHAKAPALFTQPLQVGGALAVILCAGKAPAQVGRSSG